MCKSGIACNYGSQSGRIENLRINESKNNVVGDFKDHNSRESTMVAIRSLTFPHKKAEKRMKEISAPLWEKIAKHQKDFVPERRVAV